MLFASICSSGQTDPVGRVSQLLRHNDCAAAQPLTLHHRLHPLPPPRSDVAGDTRSVCQTSIDINPFLQQTSHHSPALSTPLPGLPGLPCVRRARGMPAVSVSILIMSELYSFERNICRIRNSAALDLQLGAAGTGR